MLWGSFLEMEDSIFTKVMPAKMVGMMSKKYINNILFVCFLSVILWGVVKAFLNQNKLKHNAILVNAIVTGYSLGGRADDSYRCEFLYKGKVIRVASSGKGVSGAWSLVGRSFPAL